MLIRKCNIVGSCNNLVSFWEIFLSQLLYYLKYVIVLSLTVVRRKNHCILCVYWGSAIFAIVLKYSNLFLPFTFFLYGFHFAFCYKLIVCSKTTAFMKCIRNLFAFIQWDESLFLYFCKIHCL